MSLEKVDAYRAAAAKLGEAVATENPMQQRHLIEAARNVFYGGPYITEGVQWGMEALNDWHLRMDHHPGLLWLMESARLRLLLEARHMELEQRTDSERSRPAWKEAELGALVRAWREGVSK